VIDIIMCARVALVTPDDLQSLTELCSNQPGTNSACL